MAADTDWAGIEAEYRAGQLPLREIGRRFGVSHTAIRKRAKRDGWQRDLREKITGEATRRVSGDGNRETETEADPTRETLSGSASADQVVEGAVQRTVKMIEGHLKRAGRLNDHANVLSSLLTEWFMLDLTRDADKERASQIVAKLFPGKGDGMANAMRTLADLTRQAQQLERVSLGLEAKEKPDERKGRGPDDGVPLADRLARYTAEDDAERVAAENENVVAIGERR